MKTKVLKRIVVFFCRLTQTENDIHRTGWNCSPALLSFLACRHVKGGGDRGRWCSRRNRCEHQRKHRDCGGVLRLSSAEAERV